MYLKLDNAQSKLACIFGEGLTRDGNLEGFRNARQLQLSIGLAGGRINWVDLSLTSRAIK